MNITGMPIPVQLPIHGKVLSGESVPIELSSVFTGLLLKLKQPNTSTGNTGSHLKSEDTNNLLKRIFANLPEALNDKLDTILKEPEDIERTLEEMNVRAEEVRQLKIILGNIASASTSKQFQMDAQVVLPRISTTIVSINKKEIAQKLIEISNKAESLLSGITSYRNIEKIAPEIQKLLQQWTSLEKKAGTKESAIQVGNQLNLNGTKIEIVWRELVNAYQKRDQFVASRQYNTDAKVTNSDVVKWIEKALSQHSVSEPVSLNQVASSSMPLSKVEQYVIHLNQSQHKQGQGQQLVDKFQEVMKSSKFYVSNNGSTQLSIALRPANLGEMMVKLTQINGEMTVKIIVTSAATQDMLEANMHQLKHMFSPQQVVIERQDSSTQTQNMQQEKDQQSMNKDEQSQSEHSHQDEQKQSNDEFEKFFHEILLNEKV
ncbi:flagellar hook-length control protein FliK [Virgibacillus necropolis]|uniref:Flagellar hook-length control protein-like C-terminal domain-containing protein n=1 Tax=Virgibacillus necropolis TaxID=163877 RepID=A0A221MDH8_9BACI|nr:flagellar hook-length control protein FliK [Virgibacillus necropolis]ASN05723.1 hypothetical protein CFK40_12240 [Virgibacillus necropolis]